MDPQLELLAEKRKKLLEITKDLTVGQYNLVPPGFNNNIVWNMGHIIAVSERVMFNESGYTPPIHPISFAPYARGTRPDKPVKEEEISYLRNYLSAITTMFDGDSLSDTAVPSVTQIGSRAMQFVLLHEDYHYRTVVRMISQINEMSRELFD